MLGRNLTMAAFYGIALTVLFADPASAQRVQKNAMEKSKFYEAQREVQIIDDRPVIRDFRQAPEAAQSIELPPPPAGFDQGNSSAGAGALGNLRDLPRATASRRTLPSAGFTNHVPAALAAVPRTSQNTMGHMLRQQTSPMTATPASRPQTIASYGGYGGGSGYSQAQSSSSNVRGTLLHR